MADIPQSIILHFGLAYGALSCTEVRAWFMARGVTPEQLDAMLAGFRAMHIATYFDEENERG